MTDQLDRELAAVDLAEERLVQRAHARREMRERRAMRDHRRALLRHRLGSAASVAELAVAGTVGLVALLTLSGGDLSGWPRVLALPTVTAAFLAPAAVAGRRARANGTFLAAAAAIATFGLQVMLTFWIAFLLLGAGPA